MNWRTLKHIGLVISSSAVLAIIIPQIFPTRATTSSSMEEVGVDALKLHQEPYNLLGRKIAIGQVEIGRPGLFGIDKAVSKNRIPMSLIGVFFQDQPAVSNRNVDNHAAMVASVMVGQFKGFPGIAPEAKLYSAAVGSPKKTGQPEECLAAQHIALQNGGDVRAINFSFGESLQRDERPLALLDGNALLTQCVDWSSRVHNTLYMIAGNQGKGGIPIPTDNFNGINVAYSKRIDGIFRKVDFANLSTAPIGVSKRLLGREVNVGPRRAINIIAPGSKLQVFNLEGKGVTQSGTSFATPHVTGLVALLQEYGDRQIRQQRANPTNPPAWTIDARKAEVMKAVILNSTDKIKDPGDGSLLGMTRTVLTKNNLDWFKSDAHKDHKIPLDYQFGTGHLNAYRAFTQFKAGQHQPGFVPLIGWDYQTISEKEYKDYIIDKPLRGGSYISVTLNWMRLVELNDTNRNGEYDISETFSDKGLNNLDIYLMKADDNDITQSIWSSESEVDSVEHIFHKIPTTGNYKIRVVYRNRANNPTQAYGLAWWSTN